MLKAHHDKIRALTIQKLNAIPFGERRILMSVFGLEKLWKEAEQELGVYKWFEERNEFYTANRELLEYNYYLSAARDGFMQFCWEQWYNTRLWKE